MNKLNFLSRAEMKKVMGGSTPKQQIGGACDNWYNSSDFGICFNCCLGYEETQPAPLDPNYSSHEFCDQFCNM